MSVENLKFWYDKDGNKVYGDPKKYNKCFEYLMSNNPEDVISKYGIKIRQIFHPVLLKLLPITTKNKLKVVKRAPIPKDKPVIFAFSHGFRDDIALGLKTIKKHAYLAYASLPDFYYSIDGLALWANGVYIIDRKDKSSKKALIPKIVKAHQLGQKYHAICPEGVWDKDPNEVILNLWKGFYLASREIGAVVMPVVMLNKDMDIDKDKDKTCYSTLGDAVDLVRYADEITLDMLGQFNFIGTPSKIIDIVRKIHDNVDSCEKYALHSLSNIIDLEKYKKDNVLTWLRNVDTIYLNRISAIELLKKTEEPMLYCDEKVIDEVTEILSKMNKSKFADSYLLYDLMDISEKTFPEIKEILNSIWNIVEEADNKAVEYFRSIMVFDKIDLMEKFSNAERRDIGDAEEYWDKYVSELIKTANGLYDYSIENSAEYIDKTKVTEAEVFAPMQNARLIQKTALVDAEYFDTYVEAFVEAGGGLYNPECNDDIGYDENGLKRKIKLLPENPWVKTEVYKKKKEYFE